MAIYHVVGGGEGGVKVNRPIMCVKQKSDNVLGKISFNYYYLPETGDLGGGGGERGSLLYLLPSPPHCPKNNLNLRI